MDKSESLAFFYTAVDVYFSVHSQLLEFMPSICDEWYGNMAMLHIAQQEQNRQLSPAELSLICGINEEDIKNYLLVDTWLNNRLYKLIGNVEYDHWDVGVGAVCVTLENGELVNYDSQQIATAMTGTQLDADDVNWSYEALLEEM